MRIAPIALLIALVAAPASAANIAVADALAHVGETATVVGVLSHVHKTGSKTVFWDFDGATPGTGFTAVIFRSDAGKFPDMTPMVGKTIAITGKIKLYDGKAEIVLNTIDQVKVAQ